jgi:hypothetical protein
MDFILEIKNNLSPEMCNEIIEKFEKDKTKAPGITWAGLSTENKISTDLHINPSKNSDWCNVDQYLYERLSEGLIKYREHIKKHLDKKAINISATGGVFKIMNENGYQIQRTCKNGFYVWHNDSFQQHERTLTFLWYLNSLDPDVDGGTTDFECGRRIVPEQGKLIIFPATWTYIHRGAPVISDNTKYVCTGWILEK